MLTLFSQDLNALFTIYDRDGSGGLDYREFASGLYGKPMSSGATGAGAGGMRSPEELATAMREKLKTRGARGFIGLQRQFKIMDDNNSRSLDKYEFTKACSDYMLGFTEGEMQKLFQYFDYDNSGLVDFDEFVRSIRGPMNQNRVQIVMQAYNKLDRDGNGWVDINDVKGVYNATRHPDVQAGKKTEDQILQEFLETFETAHALRNNDAPNYVVTKEEFVEYYNNISASIDDDQYFQLVIQNAWKLTEESRQGMGTKGWSGEHGGGAAAAKHGAARPQATTGGRVFGASAATAQRAATQAAPQNANEAQLLEHMRSKLAKRGTRAIQSIGRKFKIADDNRSGTLDAAEFQKAMHDFRVGLSGPQVTLLFGVFDRDGTGEISYDEFLRTVRGGMNAFRKGIAMKAFKIMDRDGSGQLDINDIRQKYNAKSHPKVISGEKTEDEILAEFLDTFEDHYADMKGHADARDGKVTGGEWVEYYNNVSMSIDEDQYFEVMMNNTWNLDNSRVTKKGWGGEY